jgi:hypothetical protein
MLGFETRLQISPLNRDSREYFLVEKCNNGAQQRYEKHVTMVPTMGTTKKMTKDSLKASIIHENGRRILTGNS